MFKRGQKVKSFTAEGPIFGKVIRTYTEREIAAHAKTHGPEAAARLHEWFPCEFEDRHGKFRLAFHQSSLEAIS